MPINVDIQQLMVILGLKTYQLETLQNQCEIISTEHNKVLAENEQLRARVKELEDGRLDKADNG